MASSPKRSYLNSLTKPLLFSMMIAILLRGVLAQEEDYQSTEITELNCPKPMIWYTNSEITSDMYCVKQCCLPCPYTNNFYPDGVLDRTYKIFAIFGIVSFFMMLILAVWFMLLPSQRNNQTTKMILLPFVISVCCFEFPEFFTLQQQKSQCTNPVLRANIHDNHYCATQAFFTLGGAYAVASWAALLMLHLHMLSVWRSEFIIRNIFFFNIYIWCTSLLAAIIPMAVGKVEANNFCFIDRNYASIYYYFICFIYIAFLAHLMTFAYMAKVSVKANWGFSSKSVVNKRISVIEAQRAFTHVRSIFTLQWRALLGAVLMLVVYVINWNYFIVVSGVRIDSSLLSQWIQCLQNGGSQTTCSPKIIPSLGWTITLLFFNRLLGILIFIILAAKKSILIEVWDLLNGRIELRPTLSLPITIRHPSPNNRNTSLTTVEWGERLRRANDVKSGAISHSGIESSKRRECSVTFHSMTSPCTPQPVMIKSRSLRESGKISSLNSPNITPITSRLQPIPPARASSGTMTQASRSSLDFRSTRNHISFYESSRRMSSGSSRSHSTLGKKGAAAQSRGMKMKVNRSYEQRKRRSRELAVKIARNSITEISEEEGILEENPKKREKKDDDNENVEKNDDNVKARRVTFEEKDSEKWVWDRDHSRSSSET